MRADLHFCRGFWMGLVSRSLSFSLLPGCLLWGVTLPDLIGRKAECVTASLIALAAVPQMSNESELI